MTKSSRELALNVLLSVFFNLVGSLVLLGQGDDFLHCKYPDLSTQVRAPTLSTWECTLLPLVLVSLELCHKVSAMGGTSNWAVVLCSGVVIAESILRSQDQIQGNWSTLPRFISNLASIACKHIYGITHKLLPGLEDVRILLNLDKTQWVQGGIGVTWQFYMCLYNSHELWWLDCSILV